MINGKETVLPAFSGKVVKNGLPCRLNQLLSHKDEVILEKRKTPTVQELAERKQILMYQVLPVYFNDKKITLTKQLAQIQRRGQLLQMEDLLFSGDDIRIEQKPFEGFLFQDLFAFVDINMPQSGGGSFQLLRNGEQATFLTPIKKGDNLSIVWPAKTKSPSMNN